MTLISWLPRFRHLDQTLSTLADRQHWSADEIADWQLRRLNDLWGHARRAVPYYRRLSTQRNLPPRFGSLTEYFALMPVLDKQSIRDCPGSFLSGAAEAGCWHRTGGSTGDPTPVYWSHRAHREMLRAKYCCEQSYGVEVFDRRVFLWGHDGSFSPGLRGQMQRLGRPVEDRLRRRLRLSAYRLDEDHLRRAADRMQSFAPVIVYGYASAIELLGETMRRERMAIPSLRLAVMTAEPADQTMVDRVGRNYGCSAAIEYGSVECGLIAYRMPGDVSVGTRLRTRDDMVIVETIAGEDGEYDIVVTVLNNPSFPLLRYRIEDTTSLPRRSCDRGFGYLADVRGRCNDHVRTADGRRVHSMAIKHLIEPWTEIRRFTATQGSDGGLRVVLETPQPVSGSVVATIRRRLEETLQGYSVRVETTDQIPGNRAGKHRWIVSESAD